LTGRRKGESTVVRLNKIYTRTGDRGETGLVDGSRVAKDSLRIAAIGEVDELNSAIGLACAAMASEETVMLHSIQNDLFDLGADIATPGDDFSPDENSLRVLAEQVAWLERQIDRLNFDLSPLDSFILPGGGEAAARIHQARAVARRAERAAIAAGREVPINPNALAYLNRLSDLLFVLARCLNAAGKNDVKWIPGNNRSR
jgi:cob(I)alamin adenosyltransferase